MDGDLDLVVGAGGGGFIGGHLVADLLREGRQVRAIDCKPLEAWYQVHGDAENVVLDLRLREACDDNGRASPPGRAPA